MTLSRLIDSVPEHWEVKRIKHVSQIRYGLGEPPELLNDGLPFIRATDIKRGKIDLSFVQRVNPDDVPWHRNPSLTGDEILVVRSGAYTGDSAIVTDEVAGSIAGYDLVVKITDGYPAFFAYVLLSKYFLLGQIYVAKSRAAQPHLNAEDLGSCFALTPPIEEQKSIADFLHHRTDQIDTLIRKKEELIEKLQEKRSALISQTVTRGLPPEATKAAGLNPHPKMKDSGIKWLGQIPEHWEITPLGYLAKFCGGATPDKGKPEYWDGDIPWVSPKDMKLSEINGSEDHISHEALLNSPLQMLPIGAVLIVVRGMILAHSFPVAVSQIPLTVNQDMKAIIRGRKLQNKFLFWVLIGAAKAFVALTDESAHGTRKLDTSVLKRFPILVPPLPEQVAIANYLDQVTEKTDQMIEKVRSAIERLAEYRSALITAAVTGKIDVRNYSRGSFDARSAH